MPIFRLTTTFQEARDFITGILGPPGDFVIGGRKPLDPNGPLYWRMGNSISYLTLAPPTPRIPVKVTIPAFNQLGDAETREKFEKVELFCFRRSR
jgi:hypothetical protein